MGVRGSLGHHEVEFGGEYKPCLGAILTERLSLGAFELRHAQL